LIIKRKVSKDGVVLEQEESKVKPKAKRNVKSKPKKEKSEVTATS
jgi:hypothetical protein